MTIADDKGRPAVVVTGIGLVTSLGIGKAESWSRLARGESGVRHIARFDTTGLRTRIAATTDVGQTVNEAGRYSNNTLDSAVFATTHPDLVPSQLQAPASIVSGQNLTVNWTTTNTGTGPAIPGWTETVTLARRQTGGK